MAAAAVPVVRRADRSPSSASRRGDCNRPGALRPECAGPSSASPGAMGRWAAMNTDAPSAFLAACRQEPVPHVPVWFMRQAGRALPEYRAVRADVEMMTACRTADLVAGVTVQRVQVGS